MLEKEELLKVKTADLVHRLKDVFSYYEKELLHTHLRKLTDRNSIVHSAQIYAYSKILKPTKTHIKIKYVNGYSYDNVNINAMLQHSYVLDNKSYLLNI